MARSAMLKLKHSVIPQGVRPEILLAVMVADSVYHAFGHECVVTSLLDGTHSRTSLHYTGCAVDLRTRNVPSVEQQQKITEALRKALTADYDVVLESDHIHIEYQPKR